MADNKIVSWINSKHRAVNTILIVFILFIAILFGLKKQGFYIDEYYVYTFANGTQVGIDIETGKWNETSRYIGQLVSEGEENFRFERTYHNCENGVHPPLYYFLVHFMSSIFTGKFSKWIGLSVNFAIFIPVLILVSKTAWILSGKNEIITLITVALFGLSPATISMVMLTRMYLLMSMWVLLYAYIHVRDLERDRLSVSKMLIPVFICGFFGFLTQYFFVVIMFFITFVYAFYLLVCCRRVRDAVVYGLTAFFSLITTYFVWPVSVFHIFKGHRGKDAFSQAKDFSGIVERFITHFKWMDQLVFGRLIILSIPFFICGIITIIFRYVQLRRESQKYIIKSFSTPTKGLILLSIASVLSFCALTQIALMDGITCSRQLYCAYAIFLLLLPTGIYKVTAHFEIKTDWIALLLTAIIVCIFIVSGHINKSVMFIYEDEKIAVDFAREHPDECVIMFHNDDGNYDSRIQEIIMYPEVFFALANDPSTAEDDRIANADELLVYVSSAAPDPEKCFEAVYKQNRKIHNADHLWDSSSGFFSVYLLH